MLLCIERKTKAVSGEKKNHKKRSEKEANDQS